MQNIENELKERLNKGVYADIYNVPFKAFDEVLDMERDEVVLEEEEEEVSIVPAGTVCFCVLCVHQLWHVFTW